MGMGDDTVKNLSISVGWTDFRASAGSMNISDVHRTDHYIDLAMHMT